MPQHSTAQHSTAQHSTAQNSTHNSRDQWRVHPPSETVRGDGTSTNQYSPTDQGTGKRERERGTEVADAAQYRTGEAAAVASSPLLSPSKKRSEKSGVAFIRRGSPYPVSMSCTIWISPCKHQSQHQSQEASGSQQPVAANNQKPADIDVCIRVKVSARTCMCTASSKKSLYMGRYSHIHMFRNTDNVHQL